MVAAIKNVEFQAVRNETLKKDRHDLAKMANLLGPERDRTRPAGSDADGDAFKPPADNSPCRRYM